ncbi:MAG: protein kinase, partial [Planctomycetales bacterium]
LGGQLASDEQVQRFLVEAEAAANLNHPRIVPVYEFGEYEDTHYFSMAFIDGPSLADKVADNPLDAQEAADLVGKIAEGVAYAHRRGVIHRDLKPANVLLEDGDQPRITDFGLAKRMEDDSELTKSGAIMGSIFYMPPEQATGRIEDIGPAADVYALGAILYKLLTGRPPFQGASVVETINQVVDHEPVPPRRLNPRIPKDLETICLKCLQKDSGQRYQTAEELEAELDRFGAGHPIKARPIGRTAHLWRWCRRNPLPASLATGLAIVLLAGVFIATNLWNQATAERERARLQQQTVQTLSNLVLKKTIDETEEWLRLFFRPVEQQLMVVRSWGSEGLLDSKDPEELNRLLVPVIQHFPQASSMMVADGRGREHMLLCLEAVDLDTQQVSRSWKSRLTRHDEWQGKVKWLNWSDRQPRVETTEADLPDYDPRLRPWYQGAVSSASAADPSPSPLVHWTAPYVFFTTKDLGITASVTYQQADEDLHHVVAIDVLLQDITRFTSSKRPSPQGKLLVLTDKGKLIGLPHSDELQTVEQWKGAFLKEPSQLGMVVESAAIAQFTFGEESSIQISEFESQGQTWWTAAEPFRLGPANVLWILVIVPEADLKEDLSA